MLIDHAIQNLLLKPEASTLSVDATDHYPIFLYFDSLPCVRSISAFTKLVLDRNRFIDAITAIN